MAGHGELLYGIQGTLYDGNFGEGTWPRYTSFSFDPFTGKLWATYVRTANGNLFGDYYTHLCTVNLQTGKPERIIAAYTTPNWTLQIAWGVSR